jgi:hypothetical protein
MLSHKIHCNFLITNKNEKKYIYSPFCVPAKVTKLVGLTRPPFLSPTNLITFAGTQNSEYKVYLMKSEESFCMRCVISS